MPTPAIIDRPEAAALTRFHPGTPPRFLLTVDTEEEFDWALPLSRERHGLETIPRLARFQQFCEGHGVIPCYMVDYPVADSPIAAEVLGAALAAGRADIGVQMHPWVNPPFEEEINAFNSFPGNLPREVEAGKLRTLLARIAENFGQKPLIHRAGRYGAGPNTAQILREAGITIDSSVRAHFDYSDIGGPDFRALPAHPWWVGETGSLLELPLTTSFWGLLRRQGRWLHPALRRLPWLRSGLARTGLLERIPLTPEGITLDEAIRAIDIALDDGLPLLVFAFHSPSLCPGHTPYVRSEADLDALYDWWRGVFAYLAKRGVSPTTPRAILDSVALA